ncbi:DnaJ domain-containing protein [Methylobacterium sp. ARG-1]|uniref:J domain-containing protein n=1 Tax=Methylobacterium sp. ARG-1 TaxID=1692501 RepID=UPI0006820E51|nr:DnaJ domain-containing protein [Methylobacterium sp. ARG-1]KNY20398.1 molecular chaperone DnaJ [Methylobacterium sp. ARG-1]
MTQAYPLQWPQGRRRTPAELRREAKFRKVKDDQYGWRSQYHLSIDDAVERLETELSRLGATLPVLSTNFEKRLDGRFRAKQPSSDDPGVAVYFVLDGQPHCLPCDTYLRTADNIAAIAAHIEATRAIERHGVASVAEMFAGFRALPAPGATPWWQVLAVPLSASAEEIEAAFRKLARERHPDRPGGSHDMMSELNRARDAGLKERGGSNG